MDLERPDILTVVNNSDEVNGDTSSPDALAASPGSDGISLREALEAANHTPDGVTISFDPALKGTVIEVGSWNHSQLPPLAGGGVVLNGDTDGDGVPDITLNNSVYPPAEQRSAFGLVIHSSHNVIHALKMTNFSNAVLWDSPGQDQVYAGNVLTHSVIEGGSGIGLAGGAGGARVTRRK